MTCGSCQSFEQAPMHRGTDGGYCAFHHQITTKDLSCLFWRARQVEDDVVVDPVAEGMWPVRWMSLDELKALYPKPEVDSENPRVHHPDQD